jgi:cytochrome c
MNRRGIVAGAIALAVLLGGYMWAEAGDSKATPEQAQAMVEQAVQFIEANGSEATVAAVNAGEPFRDGELYVFIIGPDGMTVANGADISRVGLDAASIKDVDGKLFGKEMIERATAEGAWVEYKLENPVSREVQPKTSWVRKVNGYVIGCGLYHAARHTAEDAQAMVQKAIDHFHNKGAEATIAMVNSGAPEFRRDELYVFMVGPDRMTIANGADVTRVGLDAASIKDIDGKPFGKEMLERATAEGAWVEYKFKNPVSGEIEQKISWVRKVDGFIFGSGVYKGE